MESGSELERPPSATAGSTPGGPGPGEPTDLETRTGAVERIIYANAENGWTVVRLAPTGEEAPFVAVGRLPGVQPGEQLQLQGRWIRDPRFGPQFAVESFTTLLPSTLLGIERFLGSGLVDGIGPVLAARLVQRFGLQTLEVLEQQPERLGEVPGIGPLRAGRIRVAWTEQRQLRDVLIFLQSHGVATGLAVRIFKKYGAQAVALVRQNPYRLALEVHGIGFVTADRIAQQLGVAADSPLRAQAGLLHVLGEEAEAGHLYVPVALLLERAREELRLEQPPLEAAVAALAGQGQLILDADVAGQGVVYLASLFRAEVGVAEELQRLLAAPVHPIVVDLPRALRWLEQTRQITLADRQQEALRLAVHAKLLVITGGPGTGKTTVIRSIIEVLELKGRRIRLTAPTGRAAKRLAEAAGRDACTIHRLLELRPEQGGFARNADHPLEADLVVVDECSMVDVPLLHQLLQAIPSSCQLILVGDVDQLPAVGPGHALQDIIASGRAAVVQLDQVFRQAQRSQIIVNAHRIRQGELPRPAAEEATDFFLIEREEPAELLTLVRELAAIRIPRRFGLDPRREIQVLTPMHRGLLGSQNLNRELQGLLNPLGVELVRAGHAFRVGDRVMQQRNNYDLEVFNGDIGMVEDADPSGGQLRVRFDDRSVTYGTSELDELTLAYACSIHKSQGSEFPAVVLVLHTQHYLLLQRNLLYTAITRGRRLVVVVSSPRALKLAVRHHRVQERYTLLRERLSADQPTRPPAASRPGPARSAKG